MWRSYDLGVEVEFDPGKDAINREKHGISLAEASRFDFDAAAVFVDSRFDYGEVRFRAFDRLDGKGWCLAFTVSGATLRAISLRPASDKEMRRYDR